MPGYFPAQCAVRRDARSQQLGAKVDQGVRADGQGALPRSVFLNGAHVNNLAAKKVDGALNRLVLLGLLPKVG